MSRFDDDNFRRRPGLQRESKDHRQEDSAHSHQPAPGKITRLELELQRGPARRSSQDVPPRERQAPPHDIARANAKPYRAPFLRWPAVEHAYKGGAGEQHADDPFALRVPGTGPAQVAEQDAARHDAIADATPEDLATLLQQANGSTEHEDMVPLARAARAKLAPASAARALALKSPLDSPSHATTSDDYIAIHLERVIVAIHDGLHQARLPAPHAGHLVWNADDIAIDAIARAIGKHIKVAPLQRLVALARNTDLRAIVDWGRAQPGDQWQPEIGVMIADELQAPIRESIARMGLQVWGGLHIQARMPAASQLDAESELDRVVGGVLVRPGLVRPAASSNPRNVSPTASSSRPLALRPTATTVSTGRVLDPEGPSHDGDSANADAGAYAVKKSADSSMASLGHDVQGAKAHAHDATEQDVRKKLDGAQTLEDEAAQALTAGPAAPAPVAPTLSCERALLAALPPMDLSGPTKHVFDDARTNVERILRGTMPFSDFATFKKILGEDDHEIAVRFRSFAKDTQQHLTAILDDGKVRARARAREAMMQPSGSAARPATAVASTFAKSLGSSAPPTMMRADVANGTEARASAPAARDAVHLDTSLQWQPESVALENRGDSPIAASTNVFADRTDTSHADKVRDPALDANGPLTWNPAAHSIMATAEDAGTSKSSTSNPAVSTKSSTSDRPQKQVKMGAEAEPQDVEHAPMFRDVAHADAPLSWQPDSIVFEQPSAPTPSKADAPAAREDAQQANDRVHDPALDSNGPLAWNPAAQSVAYDPTSSQPAQRDTSTPTPAWNPDEALELAAGQHYQRVGGAYAVVIDVPWFLEGATAKGGRMVSPLKMLEILRHLREQAVFAGASDDSLQRAAEDLGIQPTQQRRQVLRIGADTFAKIGLPATSSAMVSAHGGGLMVTVRHEASLAPGAKISVSGETAEAVYRALESYTGLTIDSAYKVPSFPMTAGEGSVYRQVARDQLENLFGPEQWRAWSAAHGEQLAGIDGAAMSVSSELSSAEQARLRAWLDGFGLGSSTRHYTRRTYVLMEEVESSEYRDQIRGALARDALLAVGVAGNRGGIDENTLRIYIHAAKYEAERGKHVPHDRLGDVVIGAEAAASIIDDELPAQLHAGGGLIVDGDSVNFDVKIDWDRILMGEAKRDAFAKRPWKIDIDWTFERSGEVVHEHTTSASCSHRLKLRQGETSGVWTVHAFVRTSHFLPTHVGPIQLEVKTEEARMAELRSEAIGDRAANAMVSAEHDFDIGVIDDTVSKRSDDHGRFWIGPQGFKPRTPEDRAKERQAEVDQLEQIAAYFKARPGKYNDALAAVERTIQRRKDDDKAIRGEEASGALTFDVRATFLSRDKDVPSGPLDVIGTLRPLDPRAAAMTGVDPGAKVVTLRDSTKRFDTDTMTFTGIGATFEQALESAFVDLCKSYPDGRISLFAEERDASGKTTTSRAIGFELPTTSRIKSIKRKAFAPAVAIGIAFVAAISAMFPPAIAAIPLMIGVIHGTASTLDEIVERSRRGTLDGHKAILFGQLALNLLPAVRLARAVNTRAGLMFALDAVDMGGNVVMLGASIKQTFEEMQARDVQGLAQLYSDLMQLEQSSHPSDPTLAKRRAEFEDRAEAFRGELMKAFNEAAGQQVLFMAPGAIFHGVHGRAGGTDAHGHPVDDGYDHSRKQVVDTDETHAQSQAVGSTHQTPTPSPAASSSAAHEAPAPSSVSTHDASTSAEDTAAGSKHGPAGTTHESAASRHDTTTAPHETTTTTPHETSVGTHATDSTHATASHTAEDEHAKAAHDSTQREHPRTKPNLDIAETAKVDQELAEGGVSYAKETTAAAVPGSSFQGGKHAANAAGVLAESHGAFETAAKRFAGVTSIEKASTTHLDPRKAREEIARLDDTYLVTLADGSAFTIRITSGPIGSDAVARTVINTTKRGATMVERPGHDQPTKVEVEGRYVIQLNETMDPAHAERAMAHEVGEILAERELAANKKPVGADLLKPGTKPEPGAGLSPHDRGRIGEIKVLAAKANAGDAVAMREMIALVEELGVRAGTDGAAERQQLVRQALHDDAPAIEALERASRAETALEPDLKSQLDAVRAGRDRDIAEAEATKAAQKPVHDVPDAAPEPGKRVSEERANELARQAEHARALKSQETAARLRAEAASLPEGEYPKIDGVQIGGGAGLAARDKQALLVDARGRWQVDAGKRIAQTANQLRGLKEAGIGDPFQFAEPNERVPMSAVRYWEDSIAAQGPVIDGHVTGIAIDERGRTIMTIQPSDGGHPIKVQVAGNVMMSTGFPVERIPGTPRGQRPDKAVDEIKSALHEIISTDHAHETQAQKALHEIENLSGLELAPGQREQDLAAVKQALKTHGLEHVVEGKAKDAYDMMVAGDNWNALRKQHPDKFVLGDMANLESLDANSTNKWIIGGPGGTGISAAEIVLEKNGNAHVTMVGKEPPPGLIENDQFLKVIEKHADAQTAALYEKLGGIHVQPGDGRFSLVLGVDVQPPAMDAHGRVHAKGKDGNGNPLPADFVPEGYSEGNNPLTGGAYISSIGREAQLPAIAATFKDGIEAQGGRVTMEPKFSERGHYLGYELIAWDKEGNELRRMDVTGAASRFPPWELMEGGDVAIRTAKNKFQQASDLDAPPESGNFDGGFVASAMQAARHAWERSSMASTTSQTTDHD